MEIEVIGVVTDGRLVPLAPATQPLGTVRLTRIAMQAGRSPESDEIDLSPAEGRALLVRGRLSSGWLYSARVVTRGGPLMTAVVKQVFRRERR